MFMAVCTDVSISVALKLNQRTNMTQDLNNKNNYKNNNNYYHKTNNNNYNNIWNFENSGDRYTPYGRDSHPHTQPQPRPQDMNRNHKNRNQNCLSNSSRYLNYPPTQ